MSKWNAPDGKVVEAFKLPLNRSTGCRAYEAPHEKCDFYVFGYIKGGGWAGSLCFHPEAKGKKGGWLIVCPVARGTGSNHV